MNCRFFKTTSCNKLPACELILIKAYLVASAILNLEMENYEKEFRFQTKISFNNQHILVVTVQKIVETKERRLILKKY